VGVFHQFENEFLSGENLNGITTLRLSYRERELPHRFIRVSHIKCVASPDS
jgi:hypothetical protein